MRFRDGYSSWLDPFHNRAMLLSLATLRSKWLIRDLALAGVLMIVTSCFHNSSVSCADLHTLRGLQPVIQYLGQQSDQVQAAAAYVLGTAASNNNKFQEQLMGLHPDSW